MGKFIKKHLAAIIIWAIVIVLIASAVSYIALRPKAADVPYEVLPAVVYDPAEALNGQTEAVGDQTYALVAQDAKIALYMNLDTGEFFVKDLATGDRHFSTPQSASVTNQLYKSILTMACFSDEPGKLDERNSYTHAVKLNNAMKDKYAGNEKMLKELAQVTVGKTENGIRVSYTMGNVWKNYIVPLAMPKEDFETLYNSEALSDTDRKRLSMQYKLYDSTQGEVTVSDDIRKQYPKIKEVPQYVYNSVINVQQPPEVALNQLQNVFSKTGMTLEEAMEWNSQLEVNAGFSDVYRVYIDYVVKDGSLEVTIPTDEIWMQPHMNYKISRIDLLRYFGAGTTEDTGYMLLPDRSGTLMTFNKGKSNQGNIVVPVYGLDESVLQTYANPSQSIAYLPVFGIRRNNSAIFAVVEEGEEICSFTADVARPGQKGTVNYVYPSFQLTPQDQVEMRDMTSSEATDLNNLKADFYQEDAYTGDIKVTYHFLSGAEATWAGMAACYREKLEADGVITAQTEQTDLPLLMDLVGSIDTKKSVAGVPTRVSLKLTTYEQAQELMQKLKDGGVANLAVRYQGWANGGVLSSVYNDVKPLGVLGGKGDFEDLVQFAKDNGVDFYPNAEFLYIYKSRAFDGFSKSRSTARALTKDVAYKYVYSPVSGKIVKDTNAGAILKPMELVKEVKSFLKSYAKYGGTGLSAASLGTDANSDFNAKAYVNRGESIRQVREAAAAVKEQGLRLLVDGGNEYILEYADMIANAPVTDTGFYVSDECVPFVPAVLHGYLPYTIAPLNQQDDEHKSFLQAVEMGAGLSYIWMYAPNKELKGVTYDLGYALNYEQWLEHATAYYKRANEALKPLSNQTISDHRRLMAEQDVFVTVYSSGAKVYVNYTDTEIEAEGVKIPARDFIVVAGN